MICNSAGIKIIEKFEGLRLTAYRDSVGILTIGYGHIGKDVKEKEEISAAMAHDLLIEDIAVVENFLNRNYKEILTENQFSALCSFIYNIGIERFKEGTIPKAILRKDFGYVSKVMKQYVYAGGKKLEGLVKRREAEVELWQCKDA